jgi:hypothetical protein
MAISAESITKSSTLEQLRTQFNNLVSDLTALEAGKVAFTEITTTTQNVTTMNVAEDGTIIFEGATNDDFETTLTVADPTADRTITLPNETGTVLTTASTITATNVTVSANNSTNETIFLTFVDGATGTQGLETDTGLTYNPSTGLLTSEKLLISDDGTIGSASSTSAVTIASTGIVTFVDDILIKDGGTIGNASVADVMTLASTGIVTFKDDLLIKDGGTIGVASSTSAITIASTGIVTFVDDIIIKDAGTIGSASDTDAISISSGGVVNISATTANTGTGDGALTVAGGVGIAADASIGDDLRLISDSAVLSFGADSDTTLTHTDGSGLTINSTNKIMFRDSALSVSSSADGQLDIDADTEVEITATTIDINGDVEISGTTTQTGISTSAAKDVFNAGLSVKNGSTSAGFIEFFEDSDNGTNKVTLIGPASSGDVTLTLPAVTDTVAAVGDITALAIALG